MQESDYYRVGKNGVREMVAVDDPEDPFPETVLGAVSIKDVLLDLERFSIDPSHGGQISVELRDPYFPPAWSVNDSSSASLLVRDGPGENIVRNYYDSKYGPFKPDEPPKPSPPVVPVPTLTKYVAFNEVTLADTISQVAGPTSDKSTSEAENVRQVFKVCFPCCSIKMCNLKIENFNLDASSHCTPLCQLQWWLQYQHRCLSRRRIWY